jgi:hypothetical protein
MTDRMTTEEILAAKARAEAATPGPWRTEPRCDDAAPGEHLVMFPNGEDASVLSEVDAAFIAAARSDVPRLADDLLAANARCAAWERLYLAAMAHDGALDTEAEGAAFDAFTSARVAALALGLDV